MSVSPWWGGQLRGENKRPQLVLRAANPPPVRVQGRTKVLLGEMQAVRTVSFEVLPDLLDRVEFRCVARKPLDLEPRVSPKDGGDQWPLVYASVVPEHNYVSPQVTQQCSEKLCHVDGLEVLMLKPNIQSHVLADGGDRQGSEGGDTIVSVAIEDDGCIALWSPGPVASRDEHEAGSARILSHFQRSG